jgi:hypothetical protein
MRTEHSLEAYAPKAEGATGLSPGFRICLASRSRRRTPPRPRRRSFGPSGVSEYRLLPVYEGCHLWTGRSCWT